MTPTLPTYEFYTENGFTRVKSKEDFDKLLIQASIKLNRFEQTYALTYYPSPDKPDGYMRQMALCALCDEIQLTNMANDVTGENGIVRSVSFSSASTTFDGVAASDVIATTDKRYENAIRDYAHIGRGVYARCR